METHKSQGSLSKPAPALSIKNLVGSLVLLFVWSPTMWAQPATGHPRLWVREADLPRLRSWAVDSNPIYAGGLGPLLTWAKTQMDEVDTNNVPPSPNVPNADSGGRYYEEFPTEAFAELFAFMSLVTTDPVERDALAQRSRTLLL